MTQLDIVKAFLEDADIQTKYGLTPGDMAQMTMSSQHSADAQALVNLVRQMVTVVEHPDMTVNTAAARLNSHLETALR